VHKLGDGMKKMRKETLAIFGLALAIALCSCSVFSGVTVASGEKVVKLSLSPILY